MRKYFALLVTILCLVTITSGVFAMTPRVKFPEWNNTSFKITDWNPQKGILTLTVTVEANRTPLSKIHSQPYLQSNFNTIQSRYEKDFLEYGKKATFNHRINIKSNTTNWVELDVRAMPDIAGLKILTRSAYSKEPALSAILEAEADQIKSPIFIGTSLPILVRDDIALTVTPEIAFSPSLEHKGSKYYLWIPLDSAENPTTTSTIKLFKEAINKKDLSSIEAAGQNLVNRFSNNKRAIVFKRAKGDNFMIPTNIALEMLRTDISTLKAVLTDNPTELEKEYKAMPPCYTKAFAAYNLSQLFKSLGNEEKAKIYLNEALLENPAWPLAKQ